MSFGLHALWKNAHPSWHSALPEDLVASLLKSQDAYLATQERAGARIEPPRARIFRAFELTPLDRVRVVILGQDPYPTPGHAIGLAFGIDPSVEPKARSLLNLFKEIESDLGLESGTLRQAGSDLTGWAAQGVLLLNTVLTVDAGEAGSHQGQGWEKFTDAVIRTLDARTRPVVFLLWGKPAQAKSSLIVNPIHPVLMAAHPSPLSASRGFFGCRHFSEVNHLLQKETPPSRIDWGRVTE